MNSYNNEMRENRKLTKRQKLLAGMTVAVLFGILVLGLRPKGFDFLNGVSWIAEQPGIRFTNYAVAYTNASNFHVGENFAIELALKPKDFDEKGFDIILAIHDGRDCSQLIVGQWRSWIVVMNGDDYSHRKKTKRIAARVDAPPPGPIFVTITQGKQGAKLYIDGKLVKARSDLDLKIPQGRSARLVLGNTVYGNNAWQGDMYGLAFYDRTLSARDVAGHRDTWLEDRDFSFAKKEKPFLLYLFDETGGTATMDHGTGSSPLHIPAKMHVLKKRFLSPPWIDWELNRSFGYDSITNFLGFIPLGVLLTAALHEFRGALRRRDLLTVVIFCFTISLAIETAQAWMPSRSSDLLDLVLNTTGAAAGAIMVKGWNIRQDYTA